MGERRERERREREIGGERESSRKLNTCRIYIFLGVFSPEKPQKGYLEGNDVKRMEGRKERGGTGA